MALQLRFRLSSGEHAISLSRVSSVAAFARLEGESDGYFLGWLRFHGEMVPVFDLNQVVCEEPTKESFGSRILVLEAAAHAPVAHVGLLAAGVTDTVSGDDSGVQSLEPNLFLSILYPLIPPVPAVQS